jgi:hypothetical protein
MGSQAKFRRCDNRKDERVSGHFDLPDVAEDLQQAGLAQGL